LVFGDLNDPNSEVSRLSDSNRGTRLLGELGTKPNVSYLQRGTWQDAKNS
jgi:molybdopterin-containing oxidoreductase family iron-sulfur binding subunit